MGPPDARHVPERELAQNRVMAMQSERECADLSRSRACYL